jgi:redox-sensitive bicupin YhaK (pirin superfamily)
VEAKVIAGRIGEVEGPVKQPATDPSYFDLSLDAARLRARAASGPQRVRVRLRRRSRQRRRGRGKGELLVFGAGERVRFEGRAPKSRLILVAGRPISEPVARYGPFVMNTQAEIVQAVQDFQAGRF